MKSPELMTPSIPPPGLGGIPGADRVMTGAPGRTRPPMIKSNWAFCGGMPYRPAYPGFNGLSVARNWDWGWTPQSHCDRERPLCTPCHLVESDFVLVARQQTVPALQAHTASLHSLGQCSRPRWRHETPSPPKGGKESGVSLSSCQSAFRDRARSSKAAMYCAQ